MNNITTILIAILGSGAFTAIVNAIINRINENKNKEKEKLVSALGDMVIIKKALQSELRNDLREKYYQAMKDGYMSLDDKDDFDFMYQQYHALGSNGVMTKCYEAVMALPTEKQEDA